MVYDVYEQNAVAHPLRRIGRVLLLGGLALSLMACQPVLLTPESAGSTNSPTATAAPREEATPAPQADAARSDMTELEQNLVDRAKESLASELGIDAGQVTLMEMEAVEWPDASLGCPQPDMMYAQVITPGYRILLQANGERYEYHTDARMDGQVVLCQNKS